MSAIDISALLFIIFVVILIFPCSVKLAALPNNRFEKGKQKTVELEMLILELNKEFGLIDIMSKMEGEIKSP